MAICASLAVNAQGQISGDGYYRVQNVYSGRYLTVINDYVKVNYASTSVDLSSMRSIMGFDNIAYRPASIIKIVKVEGTDNEYSLLSQGINTTTLLGGRNAHLTYYSKTNSYRCYGEDDGYGRMYISDALSTKDTGWLNTNTSETRDWYIYPVSSSDCYFGIKPQIQVGKKYYASFYASFPIKIASSMKAYIVNEYSNYYEIASLKEITDGIVPGATPVIIECQYSDVEKNKVEILDTDYSALSGNLLSGEYFCYMEASMTANINHFTAFDATTMRVLGTDSNGNLALVNSTDNLTKVVNKGTEYIAIPENTAYLKVTSDTPASLKLLSTADYAAGVTEINAEDRKADDNVYTITGVKINDSNKKGIYITNGRKYVAY